MYLFVKYLYLFRIIKSVLLFLILFVSLGQLQAQNYTYSIRALTPEQGLTSSLITNITEDSSGFIWFSSPKNIYRYDGYEFEEYKPSRKINYISEIFPENEERVWIFSYSNTEPIMVYNRWKDSLISLKDVFPSLPFDVKDVVDFHQSKNDCWISTKKEIYHYTPLNGFIHKATAPDSLNFKYIEFIEPEESFFVSLISINKDSTNPFIHEHLLHFSSSGKIIEELSYNLIDFSKNICAAGNSVWVLGESHTETNWTARMFSGEKKKEIITLSPIFDNLTISREKTKTNENTQLLYIKDKLAWLLMGSHLYLIDFEKGIQLDITQELKQYKRINSLEKIDTRGNLWATTDVGVLQINIQKILFKKLLYTPKTSSANNISTREILKKDTNIWICSYSGLYKKDNDNFQIIYSSNYYGATQSNNDFIYAFKEGSESSFVFEINSQTYKYRTIYTADNINSSFRSIYNSKSNRIWLGGINEGLFYIPKKRDSIYKYENKELQKSLKEKLINQIVEYDGYLWLATSNGVYQLNLNTTDFKVFNSSLKGKQHLPVDNISFIHKDKIQQGIFWLGTSGEGLLKWIYKSGKYVRLTEVSGLSDNSIHAIYEDEINNLWMSSNFGLMMMNKKTLAVDVFFEEDGITDNEFNFNSSYQANDGKIYFGGLNGVTSFYPDSILNNRKYSKPILHLISCQILNFNDKTPAFYPVNQLKKRGIELSPDNVNFSLSFSLLNYELEKYNYYQYKISGFTNGWVNLKHKNSLVLNFPSGEYELYIRGKAKEDWSDSIIIPITLSAYFYKTSWFYIFSFIVFSGFMFLLFKMRAKKLKKINNSLETKIELRTKEIKLALEEKDILFKEVHHRVKNNFTILKSLLYLQSKNSENIEVKTILKECENRIQSMALVHNNLYTTDNISKINLKLFLERLLYELIDSLGGIDFEIKVTSLLIELSLNRAIYLSLVINELATNSFKHAFKGIKTPIIGIDIFLSNNKINIKYFDNGIGLPSTKKINDFKGFGFKLIQIMMNQLNSKISYEKKEQLTTFVFQFDL